LSLIYEKKRGLRERERERENEEKKKKRKHIEI
jgi:hypothetical protein